MTPDYICGASGRTDATTGGLCPQCLDAAYAASGDPSRIELAGLYGLAPHRGAMVHYCSCGGVLKSFERDFFTVVREGCLCPECGV